MNIDNSYIVTVGTEELLFVTAKLVQQEFFFQQNLYILIIHPSG